MEASVVHMCRYFMKWHAKFLILLWERQNTKAFVCTLKNLIDEEIQESINKRSCMEHEYCDAIYFSL